jgi:hypothetical protein
MSLRGSLLVPTLAAVAALGVALRPSTSLPPQPLASPHASVGASTPSSVSPPPSATALPPTPAANLTDQVLATCLRWATTRDPETRDTLLSELSALLTDDNAAELLRALPLDLLDTPLAADALARWSGRAPAEALDWVHGQSHPATTHVVTALRAWMGRDPASLRTHLATLPAGVWRQQVLLSAGRLALQQNHPADAALWLARVPLENRPATELHWAALHWGSKDAASAMEWALTESDPGQQETRLAAILLGHASTDPGQALDLALGLLETGTTRERALADIMGEWARRSPPEAAAALDRFPEGETRAQALSRLLAVWLDYDPAGARAWVAKAPALVQSRAQAELDRFALAASTALP